MDVREQRARAGQLPDRFRDRIAVPAMHFVDMYGGRRTGRSPGLPVDVLTATQTPMTEQERRESRSW